MKPRLFLKLQIRKLSWNPVMPDLSAMYVLACKLSVEADALYYKVQTQSVSLIQKNTDDLGEIFLEFSCYAYLRDCVTRSIHRLSLISPMDRCEDTDMH